MTGWKIIRTISACVIVFPAIIGLVSHVMDVSQKSGISGFLLWDYFNERIELPMQSLKNKHDSCIKKDPVRRVKSDRIASIIQNMSLVEKLAQMAQVDLIKVLVKDENTNRLVPDDALLEYYFGRLGVGSILNAPLRGTLYNASEYRSIVIKLQNITRAYKRPPVIWGLDSVHGANYIHGAILTPQQINLAATFNETVSYVAGSMASRDTRAAGITWLFAPIMDVAIQPLWARVYETFGEDPLLISKMGRALIQGLQHTDRSGAIPSRAAACAKHFIGYSDPRTGHDRSPSWIPIRHLHQYFVPPWRAIIKSFDNALIDDDDDDGYVMTIMESYTEYDGVPNVVNHESLVSLLRYNLGFDGVLVTDYQEIENLVSWHRIARDRREAIELALQEGSIDMSMVPLDIEGWITDSANVSSYLETDRIDISVKRILSLKEKLNMFDEEILASEFNLDKVGNHNDRSASLDMARQSIILTKNDKNTLPIPGSQKIKLHVVGPTSDSTRYQTGGWTLDWQGVSSDDAFTYGTTVLDAASKIQNWAVTHSCGVTILGEDCDLDGENISQADYVIVCIGEENYTEKPGDIRDLNLPDGQYTLLRTVKQKSVGKIIVVYFGGRPRLLRDMVDLADAFFVAFLPGPDGGQAVIDLMEGTSYNPSGRLPVTYPKYSDGAGAPYWHAVSELCTSGTGSMPHYSYDRCQVQWPFGYGLSYTTFEYGNIEISSHKITFTIPGTINSGQSGKDKLTMSVVIRNTGEVAGTETVMFFIFDEYRRVTPEYKRLRAFKKVFLYPNEEAVINATVSLDDFRHVGSYDNTHMILQPGMTFRVGVGSYEDCRINPNRCSDPVTVSVEGGTYVSECEAACKIWQQTRCGDQLGLNITTCWSLCTTVDVDKLPVGKPLEGWGWNYVTCLESMLVAVAPSRQLCDAMTNKCRNIVQRKAGEFLSKKVNFIEKKGSIAIVICLVLVLFVFIALRNTLFKCHIKRNDVELVALQQSETTIT